MFRNLGWFGSSAAEMLPYTPESQPSCNSGAEIWGPLALNSKQVECLERWGFGVS